jgi:hypothetical protein
VVLTFPAAVLVAFLDTTCFAPNLAAAIACVPWRIIHVISAPVPLSIRNVPSAIRYGFPARPLLMRTMVPTSGPCSHHWGTVVFGLAPRRGWGRLAGEGQGRDGGLVPAGAPGRLLVSWALPRCRAGCSPDLGR